MARRKGWHFKEEDFLANNYEALTIKELIEGLKKLGRDRSADSINSKIKRMKAEGQIEGTKDEKTVTRSLKQRKQ